MLTFLFNACYRSSPSRKARVHRNYLSQISNGSIGEDVLVARGSQKEKKNEKKRTVLSRVAAVVAPDTLVWRIENPCLASRIEFVLFVVEW